MRRSLLTARSAATPLAVGLTTGGVASTLAGTKAAFSRENPATTTGTLTSATTRVGTVGATFYFFSVNPATMTVRAVSGTATSTTNLTETHTISLSIVAGDYIGIAITSAALTLRYGATGGTAGFDFNSTANPGVGASVAGWINNASPNLLFLSAAG